MTSASHHGRWRILAGFLAASLIIGALLWKDRTSVERGNRLYRGGEVTAAAEVYRANVTAPEPTATISYNLGTSLLALDAEEAAKQLRLAAGGVDSAAAQRGYYNLGYLFLTSVDPSDKPEAAIPMLLGAVSSNRAALRLDPRDQNARWNLALAQQMLDSLGARVSGTADNTKSQQETQEQKFRSKTQVTPEARGSSGEAEGGADRNAPNPQPGGGGGQRQSIVGGESEARAGQDPGPLTLAAALRLVKGITDSPEQLVRGLLWSHRPHVAWWQSQPFPGGNW
jgi:hypothetical protein